MSPLLTDFAGVSIYALGFARGGAADKYFIATAATATTTYPASVTSTTAKTVYWSFFDQNAKLIYVPITAAMAVGSAYQITAYDYTTPKGAIKADSSGNVYISSEDSLYGGGFAQITKLNSAGTKQWSRYVSKAQFKSHIFDVDSSGNVYSVPFNNGAMDSGGMFQAYKWDTNGTQQWRKVFTWYTYTQGIELKLNSAGTYAWCMGGMRPDTAPGMTLVKVNNSGTIQWSLQNSTTPGMNVRVAIDSADNAYTVHGYVTNRLTKVDSSGNYVWARSLYNSNGYGNAYVTTDSTDNVYVLWGDGSNTLWLAKWNSSGTIQWQRSITSSTGSLKSAGWAGTYSVNGFHATDTALVFTASDNNKAVLFKLPKDGTLTGTHVINGVTYTYAASSLTEASSSNPWSAGSVSASTGELDAAANNTASSASPTVTTKAIP
jgi:hypothetical protein